MCKLAQRRIADQKQNQFLQNGISKHTATKVAPQKLYSSWSESLIMTLKQKQEELLASIKPTYGSPFFSAPGFILFNGDSANIMTHMHDAGFHTDLCITSPPYNIGKEYEDSLSVSHYLEWCEKWLMNIYHITSSSGTLWLNLGYFKVPQKGLCVPIPYLLWDKSPFYLLQEIVWQYGAGVATKNRLSPRNEKWLFYVKNHDEYTFNLDDIRDPNVKYPNQKKNGKYRCNPLGKNPSDVWEFPKVTTGANRSSKERTSHPAQFPLQVVERIVLASSNVGDTVIDPFAGSCSTGIAAMGLGRLFVGIELDTRYCELSVERYKQFMQQRKAYNAQLSLF